MSRSMMERLEENKFLITQSPVLNLPVASFANNEFAYALTLRSLALHAHGDSPKELCSSRLVPFAIRTRFTVLLAGVKRVCNAAAYASPFRPLPARAPSVRKFASHLITLVTTVHCSQFTANRCVETTAPYDWSPFTGH